MSLDKSELNEYLAFTHKALDGSSKIVLDYLEQGFKSEINNSTLLSKSRDLLIMTDVTSSLWSVL